MSVPKYISLVFTNVASLYLFGGKKSFVSVNGSFGSKTETKLGYSSSRVTTYDTAQRSKGSQSERNFSSGPNSEKNLKNQVLATAGLGLKVKKFYHHYHRRLDRKYLICSYLLIASGHKGSHQ